MRCKNKVVHPERLFLIFLYFLSVWTRLLEEENWFKASNGLWLPLTGKGFPKLWEKVDVCMHLEALVM